MPVGVRSHTRRRAAVLVLDDLSGGWTVPRGRKHSAYRVDLAASVDEARRLLGSQPYTMVICGAAIPRGAAPELLEHVSSADPQVPCVFLSRPLESGDLASLLNRHLKSSLRYSLSGATVWLSGVFGRDTRRGAEKALDAAERLDLERVLETRRTVG